MEARQARLDSSLHEVATLRDENHRLKNTVVNKDSQNQQLEKFYEKEKERREAETGELRRMLEEEKARAIAAVREAEQSSTKIFMYERQSEGLEARVVDKELRINQLVEEIDRVRK